jgi:thioredoxin reductase
MTSDDLANAVCLDSPLARPGARFDVAIVGGGPAGMSAALVLGRCGRTVVAFDHGQYRNAVSRSIHGFLTRDGTDPAEFRRIAREQLSHYPSVQVREREVVEAHRSEDLFTLRDTEGGIVHARTLLLATGLVDRKPDIEGLGPLLGVRAFHCPYCDGWEHRGQPLFAFAHGDDGARFALELTLWSDDIMLCTGGGQGPSEELLGRLTKADIPVKTERITRLEDRGGGVRAVFADGCQIERGAFFYSVGCQQASPLAAKLGASLDSRAGVDASRCEQTSVPNLFVAGDASRDALQAIVAAGEGSKAALAINKALMRADLW